MLLFRVVPLLSIDEIEEVEEHEATTRTENVPGTAHSAGPRMAGVTSVLLLLAFLGMLGVGAAEPAQAATRPGTAASAPASTSATAPTLKISGAEVGGLMELTATLTGPAGQPLADVPVAFLTSTTQFGTPARLVPLGTVTTDKTGIARLTLGGDVDHLYRPTANGPQEFLTAYAAAGAETLTSSTPVNVTAARSAYHPAPAEPSPASATSW